MYGSDNSWLLGIPLRAEREDSFGEFADDDTDGSKVAEDEEDEDDEEDEATKKDDNEEDFEEA